jgi:hypothetical protein
VPDLIRIAADVNAFLSILAERCAYTTDKLTADNADDSDKERKSKVLFSFLSGLSALSAVLIQRVNFHDRDARRVIHAADDGGIVRAA